MKNLLIITFLLWSSMAISKTQIEILDPIIKMPPPGLAVSAIFLKIVNKSDKDINLVKAEGDFAGQFELHTMEMKENMMKMRQVDSIQVQKGSTTELKSGGLHIMVFDLKKTLVPGKKYNLKLYFDDKTMNEIKVTCLDDN